MKAIVTVVGKDRVGIIAAICVELAKYNVNVLDISQTIMQGFFTMMMAVDVSASTLPLAELAKQRNVVCVVGTHILTRGGVQTLPSAASALR